MDGNALHRYGGERVKVRSMDEDAIPDREVEATEEADW